LCSKILVYSSFGLSSNVFLIISVICHWYMAFRTVIHNFQTNQNFLSFLLLSTSLISLWSMSLLCRISILWILLKFPLWPSMWSMCVNDLCVLENNVYSVLVECRTHILLFCQICYSICLCLFKSLLSILNDDFACFIFLVTKRRVLKLPNLIWITLFLFCQSFH
jgi:hypothetical protein